MTLDVRQHTSLIISQWQTAPRLKALAEGLLGAVQDWLVSPLINLENTQNLELARAAALDDIGERLHLSRDLVVPTDIEFFGFDDSGTGFDQAPFFSTIIGLLLVENEADDPYRNALRARGRTLRSQVALSDFIYALQGANARWEAIVDAGDGSFDVSVARDADKTRIEDLIDRNALPIPAGIGISITATIPVLQDKVYWGNSDSATDLTAFAASASTQAYSHDLQTLAIPAFTGSDYIVFAQRHSDPAIVSARTRGFEQIQAFDRTINGLTISGVDYDVWITTYEALGGVVGGDVVEFRR